LLAEPGRFSEAIWAEYCWNVSYVQEPGLSASGPTKQSEEQRWPRIWFQGQEFPRTERVLEDLIPSPLYRETEAQE
jgi:hypothetical protein